MAFASKDRLKVLSSVSVHSLQAASEKGFSQVGHRCLTPFIPLLSKMSWKTAPSSHMAAFVALELVLFFLLMECSNGLIPDMMPAKAFESLGKTPNGGFSYSGPEGMEAAKTFFLLKLRQLGGKVRSLVYEQNVWEQTTHVKSTRWATRVCYACAGCSNRTLCRMPCLPTCNHKLVRKASLLGIAIYLCSNFLQK